MSLTPSTPDFDRCTRCNSVIESKNHRHKHIRLTWYGSDNSFEEKGADLCAKCENELWKWVFDDGPDRSDAVDPLLVDDLERSAKSNIEYLENTVEAIRDLTMSGDE